MMSMIRSDREYQAALRDYTESRERTEALRQSYTQQGYDEDTVDMVLAPVIAFEESIAYEIQAYTLARSGVFGAVPLAGLGRLLIGLRIARRMSQRELANRLGVDESVVSRDERNEYHGITVERAVRVCEALGEKISMTVQPEEQACRSAS